jgi:hypothetical protein
MTAGCSSTHELASGAEPRLFLMRIECAAKSDGGILTGLPTLTDDMVRVGSLDAGPWRANVGRSPRVSAAAGYL